jgi:dienelactone hydrolase
MIEEKIIVGKGGKYPLNGILSLPNNINSAIPALVLVHGSGSNDMDETVGGNKPFRDIAGYLTSKGIAVLRYDKRTFAHAKQMVKEDPNGITVRNETIEDAILATNILRGDNRIDPGKIFILGHSLGGMLAPRIDAEGGNFRGLIIWAGSPRTLTDIMISQNEEMIPQLGKLLQIIAKKQFKSLKAKLDALESMTEDEAKKTKFFGGASLWYLKEMVNYPASDYLKAIEKPVFILHPEKDSHVSIEKDFDLYKKICAGKQNIHFKLYPELNHLFMKSIYGRIKDLKKEYKIPQNVDTIVLEDISQFILRH